jgi:hypothetical protein
MLFVLVMDILSLLVQRASEEGLLQPLSSRQLQHRMSLYADDAVVFLQLVTSDINMTLDILSLFGMSKRAACSQSGAVKRTWLLFRTCYHVKFPSFHKYLGLPLSLKTMTTSQLQSFTDHVADLLPQWKAELMSRAGRATHVQFVLTARMIYAAMAVDLPAWAIKAIDKI